MKHLILASILILLSFDVAFAQTQRDSIYFCNSANWTIVHNDSGLLVKELKSDYQHNSTYLFNAPMHIYVMEIPLSKYRVGIAQSTEKERSSLLQKTNSAVASVNGGFFRIDKETGNMAIANDFLKINGRIISPYPTTGWGTGAVAFDSVGNAHFTQWSKEMDADTVGGWSTNYPNVLVAGPMLMLEKKVITQGDDRHPRTAIATRGDTVCLIVVDGRRRKASGVNFTEMVKCGQWLGLDNMLNLDGGGSSTMFYKNHLINFPSDGLGIIPIERKVANAIVVYAK